MKLYRRFGKRTLDILFSFLGLLFLLPLFALISLLIKVTSSGPIFFSQERVGRLGRRFKILKFRTMVPDSEGSGPPITRADDERITRIGRFLRRTKLDELPQLWNVLKGEMSLVGPRPEVPCYIENLQQQEREILKLRPGLTGESTLIFRWEERLLARLGPDEVERYYKEEILPRKIDLSLAYMKNISLRRDLLILLFTFFSLFVPEMPRMRKALKAKDSSVVNYVKRLEYQRQKRD